MRVLLTGCAGFIGSKTGEFLLDLGHRVCGIDNLNSYYDTKLKQRRLSRFRSRSGFRFEPIDIENSVDLARVFESEKFDVVVNLAARAGVRASIEDPLAYLRTNTEGTLNILEQMVRTGVKKIVSASSSSLYSGSPMPFLETAGVTHQLSPYAASKLASEALLSVWHHLYGIDVSVLRYFTVFGPAGRPDMAIFRIIECIRRGERIPLSGDGSQTRDFTYVDDIARGTIAAIDAGGFEVFNLGGGVESWSIMRVIEFIEIHLEARAIIGLEPANRADMRNTSADIGKACRLLGWRPQVSTADGLRRTVDWHRANSSWLDTIVF